MSDSRKTITVLCVFSAGNKQGDGIMNLKCRAVQLDGKNISNNGRKIEKVTVVGKSSPVRNLEDWCDQKKKVCAGGPRSGSWELSKGSNYERTLKACKTVVKTS